MFLEQLREYAKQIDLPPPMYQSTPIRYVIHLNADGAYVSIEETANKENKRGIRSIAPHCKRASAIKPKLLVDNGEYTLGLARETSNSLRVAAQHAAYIKQMQECAMMTQEPSVRAVACYLESLDTDWLLKEEPDLDPADNITFQVEDMYPFELKSVQTYWGRKAAAGDAAQTMQCLVCGEMRPPVERLPIVIKGIPGGQSTGLTLISANAPAFESYGLTASFIAPTCETCGEQFGNALNSLLKQDHTHIVIPPLAYIFWASDPAVPIDIPRLMRAEPDEVQKVFASDWGNAAHVYAATLSASGARVVLRDWIEAPLDRLQQNVRRFFTLHRIRDASGDLRFFPLQSLINATLHRDSQESPPALIGQALMHVAIAGGPLPLALLHQTVHRIRAWHKVLPEQAALIKMVLLSQEEYINQKGESDMTGLNEECTDAPYLCGRLLAQLDYIQYRAGGKRIADRYGIASTAPATTFPKLIRDAQSALTTIRQKRHQASKWYMEYLDKEMAKLLLNVPVFPTTLTLSEQGMFALGFYHQKMHFLSFKGTSDNSPQEPSEIAVQEEKEL